MENEKWNEFLDSIKDLKVGTITGTGGFWPQQQPYTATSPESFEEKIDRLEKKLDTILNMLKLILTTQIKKEFEDHEELS